jgi:NAD(P)-dependent dehydrogenase (short-subunit alcohol dehydrogenase family)
MERRRPKKKFPRSDVLLILGEVPGLSGMLEAALNSDELRVRQIVPGRRNRNLANHRYEVDLSSPDALRQWHASIAGADGTAVGAVINLLGLTEPFNRPGVDRSASLQLVQWLLHVLQEFQGDLRQSAARSGGWLVNFTSLDGRFGLSGRRPLPLAQAGTLGMFKSVHREWPEVWVKTIDLDPRMEPERIIARLGEELAVDDGLVEVGIADDGRRRLELVLEPDAAASDRDHAGRIANPSYGDLPLDEQSVVLVTGGALGITAAIAKRLAREARPRLILVGRSARPGPESVDLQPLHNATAVRAHLLAAMRREDPKVLPATVERAVQKVLKDRALRANVAEMEQAGAAVEYHSLDVRDAAAFGSLIDRIYEKHGRLDGVLHGAGVIDDGLIGRKTDASLANVFSTKADAAVVLAEKLRPDSLKFLMFFSSVSSRFGNAGQTDYAAANELLNKLADHLHASWPGRVTSIQWGPWEGGMLSDELRRLYASRGIHAIPVEAGVEACMAELRRAGRMSPEVFIACNVATIERGLKG